MVWLLSCRLTLVISTIWCSLIMEKSIRLEKTIVVNVVSNVMKTWTVLFQWLLLLKKLFFRLIARRSAPLLLVFISTRQPLGKIILWPPARNAKSTPVVIMTVGSWDFQKSPIAFSSQKYTLQNQPTQKKFSPEANIPSQYWIGCSLRGPNRQWVIVLVVILICR